MWTRPANILHWDNIAVSILEPIHIALNASNVLRLTAKLERGGVGKLTRDIGTGGYREG